MICRRILHFFNKEDYCFCINLPFGIYCNTVTKIESPIIASTFAKKHQTFLSLSMNALKNLPLHDFHDAHGARFVPFGDWNMPVQYAGILEEHRAVRESAGLFDVSHMGEFQVNGPDAAAFLDHLLVNAIANAPVGKAVYSPMCQANGGTVDDLIVYRSGKNEFLLCVNASNCAKDLAWIQKQLTESGMDLTVEDHTAHYALLALQGPKASAILLSAGIELAASLGRFRHETFTFAGEELRMARTGYTGEEGFEIYVPTTVASKLAATLLEVGTPLGLKLCGLGARDSLRLEAGLPLYGHELSETINPLEAGLDWTVKFSKAAFVGKTSLEDQKNKGLTRKMVYFKLEGRRIARAGTEVQNPDGQSVGTVCSGTLSPILNCPIGSALIETSAIEKPLQINLRGHLAALQIAQPPLHKN
jgi:aminomethyltransferase